MDEIRVINGVEYKFCVTENEILAREIRKLEFSGYKIVGVSDGYKTEFYKVFGNEKKQIGVLYYDPDKCKFSLWKFLNASKHVMNKTEEVGVNHTIFSKLRTGDYIYFKIDKKLYKIRVEKAAKVGNCKNFEHMGYNSELQFFIPITELTEVESKKKTKRTRKARKKPA